jgi:hypothetical protein
MAHALVSQVSLEGRSPEDAVRLLNDQVIPIVKGLTGFERGIWARTADGSKGMGIVVFDSEDNARAARDGMDTMRPADAPPITSSEIWIVTGLA